MTEAQVTDLAVRAVSTLANISANARNLKVPILVEWYLYCISQGYPQSQWYCNQLRLRAYAEHVIDIIARKNYTSTNVMRKELARRLNVLFMVWEIPGSDADNAWKQQLYKAAFEQIRELLWERIDMVFNGDFEVEEGTSSRAAPPQNSQRMTGGDSRRQSVSQAQREPREIDLGCGQVVDEQFTSPDGIAATFGTGHMGIDWRIYSQEASVYLNCLLLRRSSFGSVQMRAWHTLSLCIWPDSNLLRKSLTLGSLCHRQRQLSSSSVQQTCIGVQFEKLMLGSGNSRARRPLTDSGSELLRHRSILQCPWNALAILFYHKYHVRKEPPPDFSNGSWMDEPVFSQDQTGFDGYLRTFCAGEYKEFKRAIQTTKQSYKRMSTTAFREVNDRVSRDPFFKRTVASLQNLVMSKRYLKNGLMETVLLLNAGFKPEEAYVVPRQQMTVPSELTAQIFPFADEVGDVSELELSGKGTVADKERHAAALGFCMLLKALRTALLQDMALLSYNPFYHRMVRGISIMLTPPFQDYRFVTFTQDTLEHSWGKDFQALIKETPRAHELGYVVPDTTYLESITDNQILPVAKRARSDIDGMALGDDHASKRRRSSTAVPDDMALHDRLHTSSQGFDDVAHMLANGNMGRVAEADTSSTSTTATEPSADSFESVSQQLYWLVDNIRTSAVANDDSVLRKLSQVCRRQKSISRLYRHHIEREKRITDLFLASSQASQRHLLYDLETMTTSDDIFDLVKHNVDEMTAAVKRICGIMRSVNESDGWASATMEQIAAKLKEAFQTTNEINCS